MTQAYLTPANDFRSSAWFEERAVAGPAGTRNGGSSEGDAWVAISVILRRE